MGIQITSDNFFEGNFSLEQKKEPSLPVIVPWKDLSATTMTTGSAYEQILSSKELTGIELRLKEVFIKDNKTPQLLFFPGLASFYMIVVVLDDKTKEPVQLDLKGFRGVDDETHLLVDQTIYYWKSNNPSDQYPSQVHVLVSVIKSKNGLRNTGKILQGLKEDARYKEIVSSLSTLVANPAGVAVGAISTIAVELGNFVGGFLDQVEDKPVFTWFQSFTDISGVYDKLGETVFKRENENATVSILLFVRDQHREKKAVELLANDKGTVPDQELSKFMANVRIKGVKKGHSRRTRQEVE